MPSNCLELAHSESKNICNRLSPIPCSLVKTMLLKIFTFSLIGFLLIYILRGFGLFAFLPGGIILCLLLVALVSGLAWGIKKTRKF